MVSLSNIQRLLAAQAFNRRVIAAKLAAGKRVSASRIGVLTGFRPKVVSGRVVALTKQKSQTRLQTERRLRSEIAFQAKKASRQSDLEIFLKNEQRLLSGRLSLSQIKADIARRKRKGLSKTPAQRTALATAQRRADVSALGLRAIRKRVRGVRPSLIAAPRDILATKRAEAARAESFDLGSNIFADPVSVFGGRTRKEVIKRGGTFGRRVGGKSISAQLDFVRGARVSTSKARIGLAQSLLSDRFGGFSNTRLKGIIGTRSREGLSKLTTPTFGQKLREGTGFFTTEAIPITKPTRRRRLGAALTAQALRTAQARRKIGRRDDLESIFVLGTQFIEPARRVTKKGIDPLERLRLARETQRETEALRAEPFGQPPPLTQARGVPTTTLTFFPSIATQPRVSDDIFPITFPERLKKTAKQPETVRLPPRDDFSTIFSAVSEPAPTKKKKRGKKPSPTRTGFGEFDFGFGAIGGIELAPDVTLGEAFEEADPFRNLFR